MNEQPLKPLHSELKLSQPKLAQVYRLSTEQLIESLKPEKAGALKVRPDGTILDGHHRVKVLRDRGVAVDALPREIIFKESRQVEAVMVADVYWIEGSWRGHLGILSRPRGGDWLKDEVRSWRDGGLGGVVSLLTPEEVREFALNQEEKWCNAYGIQFRAFSIPDRGVPASVDGFTHLVQDIEKALKSGEKMGVHCRQGIGRSAIVAAVLLVSAGKTPETAWKTISQARGLPVPDTIEQREWVKGFAQAHQT